MKPRVSIIILNWNSWEYTIECLESLYHITYPNYDVIVVDNGSEDESIKKIREYSDGKIEVESEFFKYSSQNKPIKITEYTKNKVENQKNEKIEDLPSNRRLILIKNDKNYGFTEGNNISIKYAMSILNSDYILLLNNDTVVDKSFLSEMVEACENNSKIGFIGPKIYFYEYKGKEYRNVIQFAGARQNIWIFKPYHIGYRQIDNGQFDEDQIVDYIHGSCMLIRKETIEDIGLFDKEFFSYKEENDLCMRGYKHDWKSLYVHKAIIWHKGGGSAKKRKAKLLAMYYTTRNRFLFMKKHASKLQLITFLLYFFVLDFWFGIGTSLLYHRDFGRLKFFLRSIKDGINILRN